ncbi:unnamed protein product [Polarella glacialis]|uniref:Actin n=1 Tax=Polarella glacialis TaxID=89957 RepID=A0A813LQS1_POLGL|nr:unnamed protein product [Polarella glacialis]
MIAVSSAMAASEVAVLVLDAGSCLCKVGRSGDDAPYAVFPSIVGRRKGLPGPGLEQDEYVGDEAKSRRGVLRTKFPIQHGLVVNWHAMESIWRHSFCNILEASPKLHPVLLTEAPLNPKANREIMVQIMFEIFEVPMVYIASQAVLSLYAAGRCTGLVLDSGELATHTVPVYEGYVISHAIRGSGKLGGEYLTDWFRSDLAQSKTDLGDFAQLQVSLIKEQVCYVALDLDAELEEANLHSSACQNQRSQLLVAAPRPKGPRPEGESEGALMMMSVSYLSGSCAWRGSVNRTETVGSFLARVGSSGGGNRDQLVIDGSVADDVYTLGSYFTHDEAEAVLVTRRQVHRQYWLAKGQLLELGPERFLCPEELFSPSNQACGVHTMVFQSIMLCDADLRRDLFANVILAGGSTLFFGMRERMEKELKLLAASANVQVVAEPNRRFSSFAGAARLSKSEAFRRMCISQDEYTKWGPKLVHTKCL